MPRLSVWAVRAALVYLVLGFTFGSLLLANKGLGFWQGSWALLPAHIEFLLVGWMVQLALGVAFWILPRFSGGLRGDARPAWAAFALLNLGIALVVLDPWSGTALWGRLAETAAAGLFVLHGWRRIKPLAA